MRVILTRPKLNTFTGHSVIQLPRSIHSDFLNIPELDGLEPAKHAASHFEHLMHPCF